MKILFSVITVLALSILVHAQSGRRAREIAVPVPPPAPEVTESKPQTQPEELPPVTAERNQDYRCTDDGSLARILETEEPEPEVLSSKKVDTRFVIVSKPSPSYTKEARRMGVQGFVVLKTLLSSDGKVSRVRVVRGLPAGLTANAIRAACKIKFKPAIKDGQAVAQWVTTEYVFRLSDSSIFSP
ncbi:MAG TPA: energy transducer TonB [Pyrinomonadaceae bacterium]|nr:energy transducer TonB [Pyrinomonadaceae bacterium]